MRVVSVQVGRIREVGGEGPPLRSGIDKRPVEGGAVLRAVGFEGDEIADRAHHGSLDQAVLFFALSRYPEFEARAGRGLAPGSFGENVTVEGTDEREVAIGDVWRVGEAVVEVASARAPCSTLARHLGDPGIVAAIREPHRAGWYARVLAEGRVAPGDAIVLVRRAAPSWTIERAARVKRDAKDVEGAKALLEVPGLAESWRAKFRERIRGG